jgi:hypothetical protein
MKILLKIILFLIIVSCADIIVEDISTRKMVLIGPSDSLKTSIRNQVFLWEQMPGAERYRLSIAKPHFQQVELIVLDTSIEKSKFNFTFQPGFYEWRVRAENSAYLGPYTSRSIQIDSL